MTEDRAPLLRGVRNYIESGLYPFQTPGHKQGRWINKELLDFLGKAPFLADLSEPAGVDFAQALAGAQELARSAAGSEACFFLWNGTTGGILAAFLAACPGKEVVLSRSAHRSVFAALALSGAQPRYLLPQLLPDWGLPLPVQPQAYEAGLRQAAAVFFTHPSYWGLCRDWRDLIFLAHSLDKLVLVDQAHGPHFRLSGQLPPDSIAMGADLVVESSHKLGAALTQASMLHLGSKRVAPSLVQEALGMVQSTSPSFLLLLSLEQAAIAEKKASPLWERTLELAAWARAELKTEGWPVLSQADLPSGVLLDQTRLVVHVRGKGQNGISACRFLKERAGVVPEMADQHNVVFLLTPADTKEAVRRLVAGFELLTKEGKREGAIAQPPYPEPVLSPRRALLGSRRLLSLEKAAGEVSGALVVPYPPGIPLLAPGDAIAEEQVEYLSWIRKLGWQVDGLTPQGEILICQGG